MARYELQHVYEAQTFRGKCEHCGRDIRPGDSYWHWSEQEGDAYGPWVKHAFCSCCEQWAKKGVRRIEDGTRSPKMRKMQGKVRCLAQGATEDGIHLRGIRR